MNQADAPALSSRLAQLAPATVTAVLTDDVPSVRYLLESHAEQIASPLVIDSWDRVPSADHASMLLVETLAHAAFLAWPAWYPDESLHARLASIRDHDGAVAASREAAALVQGVSAHWLERALQRRAGDKLPLPQEGPIPVQLHAEQLALVLRRQRLVIGICMLERKPQPDRLIALMRDLAWLAKATQAAVVLAAPQEWSSFSSIDNALEAFIDAGPSANDSGPRISRQPPLTEGAGASLRPILGRPHPCSQAEIALAARIEKEPDLRGRFQFNMPVQTSLGTSYVADLVCEDARVVVEVDDLPFHTTRVAFHEDRQRDFELLVSGYATLRLPQDDVLSDMDSAVDKIRKVVSARC